MPADGHVFAIGARLKNAVDRGEEIVAVQRNVEADEIGAEQAIEQFRLPGAYAEGLGIGPGNMPEDRHASIGPRLFTRRGSRAK